jgi:hypothetical protein
LLFEHHLTYFEIAQVPNFSYIPRHYTANGLNLSGGSLEILKLSSSPEIRSRKHREEEYFRNLVLGLYFTINN